MWPICKKCGCNSPELDEEEICDICKDELEKEDD